MSKGIMILGIWENVPIEWLILDDDGFSKLCISKQAVFRHCYNDNSSKGTDYRKSDIRKYLNTEFFENAFNLKDKEKIVNTKLSEIDNVKDNVFLLTKSEIETLMDSSDRICGLYWYTRTRYNDTNVYDHASDNSKRILFCTTSASCTERMATITVSSPAIVPTIS